MSWVQTDPGDTHPVGYEHVLAPSLCLSGKNEQLHGRPQRDGTSCCIQHYLHPKAVLSYYTYVCMCPYLDVSVTLHNL